MTKIASKSPCKRALSYIDRYEKKQKQKKQKQNYDQYTSSFLPYIDRHNILMLGGADFDLNKYQSHTSYFPLLEEGEVSEEDVLPFE